MTLGAAQNAAPGARAASGPIATTRNPSMRIHRLLAAALAVVLASASASAAAAGQGFDPKALARYDVSYLRCEATYPEMKGHRDDAYLSLWRVKPGPKTEARLAEIRKSAPYKAEQQRASRQAASASEPEALKTLERQCKGLWGEMQRAPKPPPR